jgi:DNA helicase-2/ATP-dependent DNA helicase PcrA
MLLTHPFGGVPPPLPSADGLLAGLTPEQALAVTHDGVPLRLLAGPGAGKTRTLTHRAAYLIATRRARPQEILAVTFSVRAAAELRLRLTELLGESFARGVTAATFHSVCARLLREHAQVFGRTERYSIYDQGDMPPCLRSAAVGLSGRRRAGALRPRPTGDRRAPVRAIARQEPAADAGRL